MAAEVVDNDFPQLGFGVNSFEGIVLVVDLLLLDVGVVNETVLASDGEF